MKKAYRNLVDGIEAIASDWPESHPSIAGLANESERYFRVSDLVFEDLRAKVDNKLVATVPELFMSPSVKHSVNVMLRYCQLAAAAARGDDLTLEELSLTMLDEGSFEPLNTVASLPRKVNRKVERELGLSQYRDAPEPRKSANYVFVDGKLVITGFDTTVKLARAAARLEYGVEDERGQCGGHSNEALLPIHRSLVQICTNDQSLFPLTLAK